MRVVRHISARRGDATREAKKFSQIILPNSKPYIYTFANFTRRLEWQLDFAFEGATRVSPKG